MRLHVLGFPHTETTEDYFTCAYTQKMVKFGKMMLDRGYEVIIYSGEINTTPCTEHVPIVTQAQQESWFGSDFSSQTRLPTVTWDPQDAWWQAMNAGCIREITPRLSSQHDKICTLGGLAQRPVADAFVNFQTVEYGIGYEGVFSNYRVFESYAWMHHVYGLTQQRTPSFYDAVIPNYFDPANFLEPTESDGGYLLWMGRMVLNKGPHVAAEIARRTGLPLVMAGNGLIEQTGQTFRAEEVTVTGDNITHIGPVNIEQRASLMRNARAVLMPTLYLEPFGGVAVEAMMSGTPVITPDFGAFVETNSPNYRFHTLRDACSAVERAATADRQAIRAYAIDRFGLAAVGAQYDEYLERLNDLWGAGWYS